MTDIFLSSSTTALSRSSMPGVAEMTLFQLGISGAPSGFSIMVLAASMIDLVKASTVMFSSCLSKDRPLMAASLSYLTMLS